MGHPTQDKRALQIHFCILCKSTYNKAHEKANHKGASPKTTGVQDQPRPSRPPGMHAPTGLPMARTRPHPPTQAMASSDDGGGGEIEKIDCFELPLVGVGAVDTLPA